MEDDASDYSPAEQSLVDAIAAGRVRDFAGGAKITAEEMAAWGTERTIRATVLRQLLTAGGARYATGGIRLRGAAVEGVLDLQGMNVMPLDLKQCRIATIQASSATFTGDALFTGATFTGGASFDRAIFTHDASFDNTTFNSASFDNTTFTHRASFFDATFNSASFAGTTFTHGALFAGATFTYHVLFAAAFTGDASFAAATFTHGVAFLAAYFTHGALFDRAIFTGNASFNGTTFTDDASFDSATFTSNASFTGTTFTGNALFTGATFTGDASFDGAIADAYDFSRAQFHTTDPGPWVAGQVTLTGAVFHVRARVAIAAANIYCDRLQAREGIHLLVRDGAVNLEDAKLLRRSILAHSGSEPALPKRNDPGKRPEGFDKLTPAELAWSTARWTAEEKAFQLAQKLAREGPQETARTQVVSLRRATAGDLVLSGVGLKYCTFAGAHDLDKLRIGATCSFQRPPAWSSRTWRLFTVRQVTFEEAQWRQAHTRGWASTSTTPTASEKPTSPVPTDEDVQRALAFFTAKPSNPVPTDEMDAQRAFAIIAAKASYPVPTDEKLNNPEPTALEIAGIYRDLRKGLEDAKDEPGAADFYYGEMEMRRLAARDHRQQKTDHNGARGRRPSWTERRLLNAYWAVSGYGLRAWRALTALAILLLGCAALLTLPAFSHLPAPPQQVASVNLATGTLRYAPITQPNLKTGTTTAVPFGTSLEFSATESTTLLRASGTPLLETTGAGTVLDIALRLLAPLLLGLALLAARGRIKR